MSKEQFYDPQQIFSEKDIHFEDIPVFAYKKTVKEQFDSGRFTKEDLLTIWRDMRYIREFENICTPVLLTSTSVRRRQLWARHSA